MLYQEYLKLKKEHEKQGRLEHYQKTRTLAKPKTKLFHVIVLSVVFLILLSALCIILLNFGGLLQKILLTVFSVFIFSEIYLRFLGVKIVKCYQHYAKEETRRRCLCVPSCSEYAILCFKKYELVILPEFFARLARAGQEIYLHKIKKDLKLGDVVRIADQNGFFAVGEVRDFGEDNKEVLAIKPIRQF